MTLWHHDTMTQYDTMTLWQYDTTTLGHPPELSAEDVRVEDGSEGGATGGPVCGVCGDEILRGRDGNEELQLAASWQTYTGRAALYSPPGGEQEHLPPVTSLHVKEKCREQTWGLDSFIIEILSVTEAFTRNWDTVMHCVSHFYNFRQKR